ncbi:MAG: hypothetical protein HQL43_14830 [Alphaproteobacteria bacterium]|nr:hypothetical protein [Alphaproteobacteria bacterium]
MTRSRRSLMFLRTGLLCLLLVGMCLNGGAVRAESDEPPKMSKAEKAYIKRMIEYGKEEKQYPDKNWMYQGCRLNMHGTWYPFSRGTKDWLGRMVITGDSIIFEEVGEFPYEILSSTYGPEVPEDGAKPRRERHLYKLDRSVYLGAYWRKESNLYVVFGHPTWSKDYGSWIWRCVPDFFICDTLEKAEVAFNDLDGTANTMCHRHTFIPYTDE